MKRRGWFFAVVLLWLFSGFAFPRTPAGSQADAQASTWMQLAKLTASDGQANDQLGVAAAISGNTAVIGANGATVNGNFQQGAAYVFVKPASGWANMTQVAKLTASDGAAGDNFGWSVSISGNVVIVTAPFATVGENQQQGAVYVFVKPVGGWVDMTETAKLTASDGEYGDQLGWGVSVSSGTVVVGRGSGNDHQGVVYVFVEPAGGWVNETQAAELTASDGGAGDFFGQGAVGISGNTVVAGRGGANNARGAAYVFVEPTSGWMNMTQTAELTAFSGRNGDSLGGSVAISGNTVAAGAPGAQIGSNAGQGAAYVFVKPTSGWKTTSQFNAKLTASGGETNDELGYSVSVSANTVLAGALLNSRQGAAYIFTRPKTGWKSMTQTAKLTASDGAPGDRFGLSVSISGNTAVAGAPYATIGENQYQGAAYVFGP